MMPAKSRSAAESRAVLSIIQEKVTHMIVVHQMINPYHEQTRLVEQLPMIVRRCHPV